MLIHYRLLLPILIHASPILIHALPILIHLPGFQPSAPYLIALNRHDSSRQPIRIGYPRTLGSRQPIRIKYYVTRVVSQSESSTLGSRQSSRIEYYVTQKHPRALGYGEGPFSALSSRLAIAYLNT